LRWRSTSFFSLVGFTHNDPFEDTERRHAQRLGHLSVGFTHNDPFEDTERRYTLVGVAAAVVVSPTTIRSRILKELSWLCAKRLPA